MDSWELAHTMLQGYDELDDPSHLDAAIELLLDVADDPEHPLPIACHWMLSQAYRARGERNDRIADLDEALGWALRLAEGITLEDPDTDELIVHMADLYWNRSWTLRYAADQATAADTRDLVQSLAGLRLSGANPVAGHYLRLLVGSARLDGYANLGSPVDRRGLDDGLADAGPAMTALLLAGPDAVAEWVDDRQLRFLGALLGHAYVARFDLDGDPDDLDRAVELLTDATSLCEAYRRRWEARREPGDLDAAIRAAESLLTQPPDETGTFPAANLADLLVSRAAEREQPSDARRAAALLEQIADDDAFRYLAHQANMLVWRLTGEPTALHAAAGDMDRVLAFGPAPGHDLLAAHVVRLDIERHRTEAGLTPPPDPEQVPGRSAFRDLLEATRRVFDGCPDVEPELRARAAGSLALAELLAAAHDLGSYDVERIRAMLTMAATADLGEQWQAGIDVGLGILDVLDSMDDPRLGAGAVQRFVRAAERVGEDLRRDAQPLVAIGMQFRSDVLGDRRSGLAARAELHRAGGLDPLFDLYLRLGPLLRDGDTEASARLLRQAAPIIDAAMPGTGDGYFADYMRLMRAAVDPEFTVPLTQLLPATDPTAPPGLHGTLRVLLQAAAAVALCARGLATDDPGLLRQAAERSDAVFAAAPATDRRLRLGTSGNAGLAYLELARRSAAPHEPAALAVDRFTTAMECARDHRYPLWSIIAMGCAEAVRLTAEPDLPRSRRLGWSALRAHAWQVFAQTGTGHALAAVRNAGEQARQIGDWCVQDGAVDDLVGVLDAGRALVLRAATTSRSVADRLVEVGRPDLADAWRETGGLGSDRLTGAALAAVPSGEDLVVPDELRFEVLAALGDDGAVAGLRPVTVGEIQAALLAGATDALVYLVPGEQSEPGLAVVVPAHGDCTVVRLPELRADGPSPLAGFAGTSGAVRDLQVADPSTSDRTLTAICEWAWTAAMADVLTAVGGSAERLVLLPFGVLSVVPWHAACTWRGGRRRYLVEDTAVSYSPSARLFCDQTPFVAAPIRSALIVGNPGDDLAFAGIEARAIHRAFYPGGAYFGPGGARAGTPGDVLDWVDAAPAGLTVLHFACHAAIDVERPAEAHLILSGGATLSADALLHRSRTAALDLEQVFLAACTTSGTRSVHDEVLSLASTFLAAGARTVVGSLWPAPDAETSLLMFIVHRCLRVDGCAPAEALRRAQRWMLADDREIPADLPAELRVQCRPGTGFGLAAWAGFIHFGR